MIANAARLVVVALVSWCLSVPLLVAQAPAGAADVKALAGEFIARRGAAPGRTPGVLPTIEQARVESTWAEGFLTRLKAIDPDRLSHDDWITWAMLESDAGILKDAAQYYWFDVPVTPYNSPLRGVAGTFGSLPLRTEADVAAYVDALNRVPITLASYEARLRSQLPRGIVIPAEEFRLALPYVRSFGDVETTPFRPSGPQLTALSADERGRALPAIDRALRDVVAPAVERFAAFLESTYRTRAVPGVGLSQYPGGREYYQYLIRRHTGLALTPEQIHEIGTTEVTRLETALDQVRREAGFTGTLADFHAHLRTDRRFRAKSAEDIGDRMMKAIARIEPKVDAYFPLKPKAPYGVRRLDPALEPSMTYGYYELPSAAEPAGKYRFNGSKADERSVLMAEAVIYHELVPGHHFQIMLQRENTTLVPYRRNAAFTAYTEGWAEYASDVAGEMGMYADPYARAGRLAMDLFLSTRLVVDTGMNALGWSREKAMAFMREHTFESDLQIDTETLRYSADTPGQALAYKMGARKVHELRQMAAGKLGAAFDLKAFHAHMLRYGAMPLGVLEGHVACFVSERHKG